MMQKFRLNLRALKLRIAHKKQKKVEIWERDLPFHKKFKINATIKWRRFDTQTRGMGMVFVLIMMMMIVINLIPLLLTKQIQQIESSRYDEQLKKQCTNQDFYNLNFRLCEGVESRP